MSLAPLGPMPLPEASMEATLLASLLQTPAKMAPQPSSPSLFPLRSRPPSPMCVMDALALILEASAVALSEPSSLLLRSSEVREAQTAQRAAIAFAPSGPMPCCQ